MIDITITATIRPDLLLKTLTSFFNNCFYDFSEKYNLKNNLHIIINIDPIGDLNYNQIDVLNICKKFSKNITYNLPKNPNFAKAVIWCWKQCQNNYIFHLEDDWILNRKIKLKKLMYFIDKNYVSAVRLYKKNYPKKEPYIFFDCEYIFKDNLFIASDSSDQFGLNPVLISRKFIKDALPLMRDNYNPEKQFRIKNEIMKDYILNHKFGIYGKPGQSALVTDIGTEWRKKRNIKKPKNNKFINWIV